MTDAYFYSLMIVSFGLVLNGFENLFAIDVFSSKGILSWKISRSITGWTARGKWLSFLYKERSFFLFSSIFLFISILLFILSCLKIACAPVLFSELILLVLLLFRAQYGLDGAYHMSLVVVASLAIASSFGLESTVSKLCMWFIVGQLILAYFIAGVRKLLSPVWQNGKAVEMIFQTEAYGHRLIYTLAQNKFLRLLLSWSVIFFEVLFPLVLFVSYKYIFLFITVAFIFHLINAIFMGLNNFLFAFCSTYPILLHVTQARELAFSIVPLLFYLIIPIIFIAWIWSQTPKNIWKWCLNTTIVGIYLTDLFLTGNWPFFGIPVTIRYLFLALFGISLVRSFLRLIKSDKKSSSSERKILSILGYTVLIALTFLSSWEVIAAIKGRAPSENTIELEFPLRNGVYYVGHGGNHPVINGHYHVIGQRLALDIVKLNEFGIRSNKLMPSQPNDYCIFSENLFSPVSGMVIKAIDSFEDSTGLQIDSINPAGNHLVIQVDDKAIVLAHLLKGSLKVAEGEWVERGKLLAKVGNSGNTSEPHLHIHAVALNDKKDFLFNAEPVSMTFNNKFLVRNSLYSTK